jgi:hypothetical protein
MPSSVRPERTNDGHRGCREEGAHRNALRGPGIFMSKNGTGDLALWWEVAHGWRLGRRTELSCGGPKDPRDVRSCKFPVVGDVVNPRRLCSSRRNGCSGESG